jgi:hypothetical protein
MAACRAMAIMQVLRMWLYLGGKRHRFSGSTVVMHITLMVIMVVVMDRDCLMSMGVMMVVIMVVMVLIPFDRCFSVAATASRTHKA